MLNNASTGQGRLPGTFRGLPITLAMVVVMACGPVFAANNPVPFIDLPTVPSAAVPGGAGFTLTVNGAGFVNGSVLSWNGSARVTTFVSAAQVTAVILASDIATPSTASITVSNPAPGGGTSNVAYFEVTTPASTINVTGLQLPAFVNVYLSFAADFNNDGKLDLMLFSYSVVHGAYVEQAAVALGNGDGTFQLGATVGTNVGVSNVADAMLGDFNGDGNLDLVVVNGSSIPYTFSIFLGNGDGTFKPPIVTVGQANTEYAWLAVGDFNQDGTLDLITQYYDRSSGTGISVLLGNGDGTFQSPVNLSSPFSTSYPLTVGDFNGDGVLDLLGFGGGVFVLPGNGDGTFQSPVGSPLSLSGNLQNVSAADVNGDGKLDLIFSAYNAGPFGDTLDSVVQLGDGNGAFSAASGFVSGVPAFPPGDFNGDGKLDFVTSMAAHIREGGPPDDLSIWIGNGDGTFAAGVPITTTTGLSLYPLIQRDFNGDGKMDLLAEDQNGGLWLFLQGSFPVGNPSPGSLNFGSQTVGTTSAAQTVTLTNTGTETLTLSAVTVTGTNASEFGQTNTCTSSLAVGAACQISVRFTPTASGARSATLNIPHDGIGSQTVPLSGDGNTAMPTLTVSPAALSFAPQGVGTDSSQNVLLTNPGPGTVTAPMITVTGANAGDFSEKNSCGSELLPGASCQVSVTFSPSTLGSRSAILKIADNAVGSPQSVALTGSGPDFSTTAPSPASLTIAAGQTANYTFDVAPLGGFSQTVTMTCGGAPAQSTCVLPASITLNGSADVKLEVTVTTTARSVAMNPRPLSRNGRWLACGLFELPLMVSLAGIGVRRRTYAYRWTLLLLVVAAISLMPACGGGTSGGGTGTPAGAYLLTVVGKYTSGATTLTHTTTLTLVVQ